MKIIPQKLEGWGYRWWKFHNPSFNSFCMIHPSDRRTDGKQHTVCAKHICNMLSRAKNAELRKTHKILCKNSELHCIKHNLQIQLTGRKFRLLRRVTIRLQQLFHRRVKDTWFKLNCWFSVRWTFQQFLSTATQVGLHHVIERCQSERPHKYYHEMILPSNEVFRVH